MPAEVEQPADMAPDGAEAPSTEAPSGDDAGKPRALDRSLFRPDLKPGSEDAAPPHSAEESKQDKLGAAAPTTCRFRHLPKGPRCSANSTCSSARPRMRRPRRRSWRPSKISGAQPAAPRSTSSSAARAVHQGSRSRPCACRFSMRPSPSRPRRPKAGISARRCITCRGKYELALADLRRALDRDPQALPGARRISASCFEALGTKTEALEAYRKALQVNPFLEDARQAVEFLSREVGKPGHLARRVSPARREPRDLPYRRRRRRCGACWWRRASRAARRQR